MPRYTKEFPSYLDADAWLTGNGYTRSVVVVRHSGETEVTLDGEFAERAIAAEHGPLAPGGFRISEIEGCA